MHLNKGLGLNGKPINIHPYNVNWIKTAFSC